ncbi:hypothetical protein LJR153_007134 [Paenibacillus sp. LjRoot153]|uniref:hypothetical protein n=1 Tax=Paenibacillus sp. LjRoot153 TaxID=3342270 RepID=UPI003ECC3FE6
MLNAELVSEVRGENRVKQKRREPSHKIKDMKFPVTSEQRIELRKRANKAKNETESNTKILLQALQQYKLNPHAFPPLEYQDTGVYMHAKPTLLYFEEIENLYIELDEASRRSMVYRLIMNYIGMGVRQS